MHHPKNAAFSPSKIHTHNPIGLSTYTTCVEVVEQKWLRYRTVPDALRKLKVNNAACHTLVIHEFECFRTVNRA